MRTVLEYNLNDKGSFMELADTIAGCLILGGIFLIFTIMNYRILFMRLKKVDRVPSPAPFIGGIAGVFLIICLWGFKYPVLILLPLLIDPGCIPLIIWFFICMINDLKR